MDGGRFVADFDPLISYNSTSPGSSVAHYEDPITVKLLTAIKNVNTKIDAVESRIDRSFDTVKSRISDVDSRIGSVEYDVQYLKQSTLRSMYDSFKIEIDSAVSVLKVQS